jgi:hypothetical protein
LPRPLRYSERKRLAETGTLGDLEHDEVPAGLKTAVQNLVEHANSRVRTSFHGDLANAYVEHFGIGQRWLGFILGPPDVDDFLDAMEILAEVASRPITVSSSRVRPIPDVADRLDGLFERFRFGYRLEGGEIHKVGSPALEAEVIRPTLLAVQRPGWEHVERSYREALDHQLGGEIDDALTAANAAVEAALKAVGMKGNTLKELARSFRNARLVPGYLANVPELLEDLLDRLHAARSTAGDAHGKSPGTADAPPELADLAVHWAGAFIVYLARATT